VTTLVYDAGTWGTGLLRYDGDELIEHIEPGEARVGSSQGTPPAAASRLAARLVAYLDGAIDDFLDVDCEGAIRWAGLTPFESEVVRQLRLIPWGETVSYAELALLAGRPRAARAAGTACGRGVLSLVVPDHRVIRSDGLIGEYGSLGHERKHALLELEATHAL
jgi:methylated-DNA-[protein]-cysteine S-methyltransferase